MSTLLFKVKFDNLCLRCHKLLKVNVLTLVYVYIHNCSVYIKLACFGNANIVVKIYTM